MHVLHIDKINHLFVSPGWLSTFLVRSLAECVDLQCCVVTPLPEGLEKFEGKPINEQIVK